MAKKKQKGLLTKTFVIDDKRYYVRAETQEELIDRYRARKFEVENARCKEIEEMTYDEYFDRWIDEQRERIRESTVRNYTFWYRSAAGVAIDNNDRLFGEIKLIDLKAQHCKDLQKRLLSLKRGDVKNNCAEPDKPLHGRTGINSIIFLMSRIYDDAIIESQGNKGSLEINPFSCVKSLKRTEPEARDNQHRALTAEETDKFMNAARNTWYYNHYKMLINSGMRIGELAALKYSDIDFTNKIIHIERTTTRTEAGARVVGDTTKTKRSTRMIELTPVLEQAINDQIALNYGAWGEKPVVSISGDTGDLTVLQKKKLDLQQLIFKTSENSLLCSTVLNRDITRKCKKAGIERFSAHAFRATRATNLIGRGVNPNHVKEALGHSSYAMTCDLYAHALPELAWKEIDAVDVAIG